MGGGRRQEGRKEGVRGKCTHFAIWDKFYSAKARWLFQRFLGCIQAGETVIMRGLLWYGRLIA